MLLTETISLRLEEAKITKIENGRRRVERAKGQHCDVVNKNKRRYMKEKTWGRHITEGTPFMNRIANQEVFGHIEHPENGRSDLNKAAIKIEKAWMEGDEVFLTFSTLSTAHGKTIASLIDDKLNFGLSSRATGTVVRAEDGVDEVQEDFEPETWDCVADPSVGDARVTEEVRRRLTEACEEGACAVVAPEVHAVALLDPVPQVLAEGKDEPGKRDGTGPFRGSAQAAVSPEVGKRKAAGEECPADEQDEEPGDGGEPEKPPEEEEPEEGVVGPTRMEIQKRADAYFSLGMTFGQVTRQLEKEFGLRNVTISNAKQVVNFESAGISRMEGAALLLPSDDASRPKIYKMTSQDKRVVKGAVQDALKPTYFRSVGAVFTEVGSALEKVGYQFADTLTGVMPKKPGESMQKSMRLQRITNDPFWPLDVVRGDVFLTFHVMDSGNVEAIGYFTESASAGISRADEQGFHSGTRHLVNYFPPDLEFIEDEYPDDVWKSVEWNKNQETVTVDFPDKETAQAIEYAIKKKQPGLRTKVRVMPSRGVTRLVVSGGRHWDENAEEASKEEATMGKTRTDEGRPPRAKKEDWKKLAKEQYDELTGVDDEIGKITAHVHGPSAAKMEIAFGMRPDLADRYRRAKREGLRHYTKVGEGERGLEPWEVFYQNALKYQTESTGRAGEAVVEATIRVSFKDLAPLDLPEPEYLEQVLWDEGLIGSKSAVTWDRLGASITLNTPSLVAKLQQWLKRQRVRFQTESTGRAGEAIQQKSKNVITIDAEEVPGASDVISAKDTIEDLLLNKRGFDVSISADEDTNLLTVVVNDKDQEKDIEEVLSALGIALTDPEMEGGPAETRQAETHEEKLHDLKRSKFRQDCARYLEIEEATKTLIDRLTSRNNELEKALNEAQEKLGVLEEMNRTMDDLCRLEELSREQDRLVAETPDLGKAAHILSQAETVDEMRRKAKELAHFLKQDKSPAPADRKKKKTGATPSDTIKVESSVKVGSAGVSADLTEGADSAARLKRYYESKR